MNELSSDIQDIHNSAYKIIDANGKFKVYEDGYVEGTSAHFSGESTFEGIITANGGTIGGLSITEWKEMGYSVRITSEKGTVLKGESSTLLTATFYMGNTPITESEITKKNDDGTETTYNITYQWKHDDYNLPAQSVPNELEVVLSDNSSETYYCDVILIPKMSNGG
jgi:hypothetical protein